MWTHSAAGPGRCWQQRVIHAMQDGDDGPFISGVAYLFDGETGSVLQTFHNPTPDEGDWFGQFKAVLWNNVLLSAQNDDFGGQDAGVVYLFDSATGEVIHTFVNPDPGNMTTSAPPLLQQVVWWRSAPGPMIPPRWMQERCTYSKRPSPTTWYGRSIIPRRRAMNNLASAWPLWATV